MISETPLLERFEPGFNRALQRLLETDPANQALLEKLEGTVVEVVSLSPEVRCFLGIRQGKLRFRQHVAEAENVDLSLTGRAANLLKLLATPPESASRLRGMDIEIVGDVGLLLEISQIAKQIEIDWEALLAEKIGDAPAVVLSRIVGASLRGVRSIQEEVSGRLKHAAASESSALPNRDELERAKHLLRELHYRLDRVEVKLDQNQRHKP